MLAVRGNFQEGNFGDDALLVAVQLLISPYFRSNRIAFDAGAPVYKHGLPGYARALSDEDRKIISVILYGGGTQFFSFAPHGKPTDSQPYRRLRKLASPKALLESLKFRQQIRRTAALPVFSVGVGFGPFSGDDSAEQSASEIVRRMNFVWARDPGSASFAQNAGCKKVVLGADLCFLQEFSKRYVRKSSLKKERASVGIVLRNWPYANTELSNVARWKQLAKLCRQENVSPQFFAFSKDADRATISALTDFGEEVCIWDPSSMRIEDFCSKLDECTILLTSRYHGAIFSMLLDKPFIAIGIEPKLENIGASIDRDLFLLEIEESVESILDRILVMLANLTHATSLAIRAKEANILLTGSAKLEFDQSLGSLLAQTK